MLLRVGRDPLDDYYALLGIEADADDAKLRRVWRRLALRWHPDRAGSSATAMFQKISTAYAVLSDPTARAAYDRGRDAPVKRPAERAGGASTAPSPAPRRRAPGVMLARLSGPLNALFACGVARRAERDVIELFINAQEAAQGGMVTISMRVLVRCPECAAEVTSCRRCGGKGATDELFSAWLAVPPEVADGAVLAPSELLRGMVRPVHFRMRVRGARSS
jgi:molecular chaperone DnaJ